MHSHVTTDTGRFETEAKTELELKLEDTRGEFALDWVKQRNYESTTAFAESSLFNKLNAEVLSCGNNINPTYHENYLYDYLQDEAHINGIWRRVSLEEYRKDNCSWETLLDLDSLLEEDQWMALTDPKKHKQQIKESWVFKQALHCKSSSRVLIILSLGGSTDFIFREFDVESKTFVKNGFAIAEGRFSPKNVRWCDENSLWITNCSYEQDLVERSAWYYHLQHITRGEPLRNAKRVYEAGRKHIDIETHHQLNKCFVLVKESLNYFDDQWILVDDKNFLATRIPIPADGIVKGFVDQKIVVTIRKDWKINDELSYPSGSVIGIDIHSIATPDLLKTELIFAPTDVCIANEVSTANNFILIEILNNVNGEIHRFECNDGKWVSSRLALPEMGQVKVLSACLLSFENFITPNTLYYYDSEKNSLEMIKQAPKQFDATNMKVSQYHTFSKDSVAIPYYVVHAMTLKFDGANPTILYGYGGFEVSKLPEYQSLTGKLWLSEGGVYVLANIRGGGEFGAKWHQAAIKENRHKAFEDFIAVAADLIEKKITSPQRLGLMGGSNGGLLVGVAMTQRPDLFNAVICRAPLLDMLHFSGFGKDANTSSSGWASEYGDPKEEKMFQYIKSYSPYHNVSKDKRYPRTFFFSATNDDITVPGHARKMVNKMQEMGHEVYYFENTEGGHGGKGNFSQHAYKEALTFTFLQQQLMGKQLVSVVEFEVLSKTLDYLLGVQPSEIVTGYLSVPRRF